MLDLAIFNFTPRVCRGLGIDAYRRSGANALVALGGIGFADVQDSLECSMSGMQQWLQRRSATSGCVPAMQGQLRARHALNNADRSASATAAPNTPAASAAGGGMASTTTTGPQTTPAGTPRVAAAALAALELHDDDVMLVSSVLGTSLPHNAPWASSQQRQAATDGALPQGSTVAAAAGMAPADGRSCLGANEADASMDQPRGAATAAVDDVASAYGR